MSVLKYLKPSVYFTLKTSIYGNNLSKIRQEKQHQKKQTTKFVIAKFQKFFGHVTDCSSRTLVSLCSMLMFLTERSCTLVSLCRMLTFLAESCKFTIQIWTGVGGGDGGVVNFSSKLVI